MFLAILSFIEYDGGKTQDGCDDLINSLIDGRYGWWEGVLDVTGTMKQRSEGLCVLTNVD